MKEFSKLERGNNWGAVYFKWADGKGEFHPPEGSSVTVQFPDGTILFTLAVLKKYHTSVGDMGHTYPVIYNLAGVDVDVHGLKVWIPLDELEVAR